MALTDNEARERFGMTTADAHRIRDLAMQRLSAADVAKARAAWRDMAHLARASKHHPETVRFRFLTALADGYSVTDATDAARTFAEQR